MKPIFYAVLFISTAWLSHCKKQSGKPAVHTENRPAGFTENKIVAVNTCSPFTQNAINYSICLDSVTSESRCPQGAQCVWMGYARTKLTFTAGSSTHHFSLCTLIQSGAGACPNDTTINGIKIQLADLTPYPNLGTVIHYNDYKAEVVITQQ